MSTIESLEPRRLLATTPAPSVTKLAVMNLDTGERVAWLKNRTVINLATLATRNLNVRAWTTAGAESVKLTLDGRPPYVDNATPYSMAGDRRILTKRGEHELVVSAYSEDAATGDSDDAMRVRFSVVNIPTAPNPTPPALEGNWNLAFADEFDDAGAPDASVWADKFWWGGNVYDNTDEFEAYDRGAATISNGVLNITATKQSSPGTDGHSYPYRSALLTTGGIDGQAAPGFTFTYGYAEARIKIPKGQGIWPAFWMLPASHHDGNGEIDVMEVIGSSPDTQEMHYHVHGESHGQAWRSGTDLSAGYHTFAVDWQPGKLAFYVDGVERWRYAAGDVIAEPMYLMLNLAVGGDWPGPPDASTVFPATMSVDYVRVWQRV